MSESFDPEESEQFDFATAFDFTETLSCRMCGEDVPETEAFCAACGEPVRELLGEEYPLVSRSIRALSTNVVVQSFFWVAYTLLTIAALQVLFWWADASGFFCFLIFVPIFMCYGLLKKYYWAIWLSALLQMFNLSYNFWTLFQVIQGVPGLLLDPYILVVEALIIGSTILSIVGVYHARVIRKHGYSVHTSRKKT